MRNALLRAAVMCVAILACAALPAANQVWNGDSGANSNWSNGDNWVGDPAAAVVPGENATDMATFPVSGPWTVVFDSAPNPEIGTLLVESDTVLTLNANLEVATLNVASGVKLTLAGSGNLVAHAMSMAGATLDIASGNVTLSLDSSFNVTALAGYTNNGTLELTGGVSLTTNNTLDLGNLRFSSGFAVGGDILTTGRLEVAAGVNVIANGVMAADLVVGAGGKLSLSLGGEITNSISLNGAFNSAGALLLSGGLLQVNDGGALDVAATNPLTISNGAAITLDRSGTVTVNGKLIINGATSFANSDNLGIGSGAPLLVINGNLEVAATLSDANMVAALESAVRIVLAGDVVLSDVAGYSFGLDESAIAFASGANRALRTTPTQSNFDGSIAIGFSRFDVSTSFNSIPAGADLLFGSVEIHGLSNIDCGAANVVLSGTYDNQGSGTFSVNGGTIKPGAELRGLTTAPLGSFNVANAQTIALDGAIFINGSIIVENGGALMIGTRFAASDVDCLAPGNLAVQDGATLTVGATGLSGVTFGLEGDFILKGGLVKLGAADATSQFTVDGTTTLGDSLGVTDAMLDVFADNVAGNGSSTLDLRGNLEIATVGSRLQLGEGAQRFGGAMQLAIAPDLLVRSPNLGLASDPAEVHLTGYVTQSLFFNTGVGTKFYVTSVGILTNVTQSGRLRLAGDLDLSASTLVNVWTRNAGSDLLVEEAGSFAIRLNGADASFGAIRVSAQNDTLAMDTTANTTLRIVGMSGGNGELSTDEIVVEGDQQDTDNTSAADENNAGRLSIVGAKVRCLGNLTLESGGVLPGGHGNGGGLSMTGGSLMLAGGDLIIGDVAPAAKQAAPTWQATDATVNVGTGFAIRAEALTTSSLLRCVVTSNPATPYSIVVDANAHSFALEASTITGGSAGNADITLGGHGLGAALAGLRVIDTSFSNMTMAGAKIAAGVEFSALTGNSFTNGQVGGVLLSFLGNASGQTGARLLADFNTFDASTLSGAFANVVTDSGNIVRVMNDADDVNITFRASAQSPNFGTDSGGAKLTPAIAEDDDNDGTDVATPDNDILWGVRDELKLSTSGAMTRAIAVDSVARVGLMFGLAGFGTGPAVESLTVRFDVSNLVGAGIDTGSANSLVLFRDDGSTAGALDAGDTILEMDDGSGLGGGSVTFDMSATPSLITPGSPEQWGVAFAIGTGSSGNIGLSLQVGDLGPASLDVIISGLPLSGTVLATNANLSVTANFNNGAAGTTSTYLAQFDNPLVFALNVVNAPDALATTIDALTIEIDANNSNLSTSAIANVIERLVLFSSANTGFTSVYVNDAGMNYGEKDDDSVFAVVEGGSVNIIFNASKKATVTFSKVGGVAIPAGGAQSFFLVLDPSAQASAVNPAVAASLKLTFGLTDPTADGQAGGLTTGAGASDAVSVGPNQAPFVGEVLSRDWLIRNEVPLGDSSSGGCALSGESSSLWWLFSLGVLLLLRGWRRNVLRDAA